mgnify:CR=1 FL=1
MDQFEACVKKKTKMISLSKIQQTISVMMIVCAKLGCMSKNPRKRNRRKRKMRVCFRLKRGRNRSRVRRWLARVIIWRQRS